MRTPSRPAFVGRAAELLQLTRMLNAVQRNGVGQLAVIRGPAGIGKTRLAEELLARARRHGCPVGVGRSWQDGEAPPFWPWRAILGDLGAPQRLLSEGPGDAGRGRFGHFLAVFDHLRAPAGSPVSVILLDDVHQADPASLLLMRFLARKRQGLPVLLLATRRDEMEPADPEAKELLADLDGEAVTIRLGGLSDEAVRAYFAASGVPRPEPDLLRALAMVTRGNPLHLRSVTSRSGLEPGGVRAGLERALASLLEQLSGDDRNVMAHAALLGTSASVQEVAVVADRAPAAVAESLARAADVGLGAELAGSRFRFLHELVRQAAIDLLPLSDRLDAHARAAAILTGHEPEAMARRAHHALAAASRSTGDAETAVRIAREAARTLREIDGFESAATLLGRAAEIHAAAALTNPAADLLVERAEAVLACGRLADSRGLFQNAARTAEKEKDGVALARAALGLGGVWVREHRLVDEAERVQTLQRRALDGLPASENDLRARLTVRLAAEEAYHGRTTSLLEGLEEARRVGSARALAEALSLCNHALLSPEHTLRRLLLADEMIATATRAGDGLFALLGQCWRTADLFLLGDPGASPALSELRLRADALGCRSVLFVARAMEVMLAIRAGRFAPAEEAAAACFSLGIEVGDPDALAYQAAHLCAIRFFQGREAELVDLASSVAVSPTLVHERERAFGLASTFFQLRAGDPQPARHLLDRLSRDGLDSVPMSSSWMTAMLVVIELSSALGDSGNARAAYDALLPYSERPLMASLVAVVCFGSVHRALGLASLTCGKLDRAIEHFEAAVAANERLGHRPAAIQARAELALARLRRAVKGDPEPARALLRRAISEARAAGMSGLVARWREAARAIAPASARRARPGARMALAQTGRWRIVHEGHTANVPDLVGMRYLARLVSAPDQTISALALLVEDAAAAPRFTARGDAVMDGKAVRALRDRIGALRQQEGRSPKEEAELETLVHELARATGLGGRIRSFADAPERARTAVRKAIKRAIQEISAANPAVGRHLASQVETGAVCCYRLETGAPGG